MKKLELSIKQDIALQNALLAYVMWCGAQAKIAQSCEAIANFNLERRDCLDLLAHIQLTKHEPAQLSVVEPKQPLKINFPITESLNIINLPQLVRQQLPDFFMRCPNCKGPYHGTVCDIANKDVYKDWEPRK